MIIKIISIGNKMHSLESEQIGFYLKQLPKNLKIEFINIKNSKSSKNSKDEILDYESNLLLNKTNQEDLIVSWDPKGEQIDSYNFSKFISECENSNKTISFLIGGAFGLSKIVKKNSHKIFSASLLTFPHRLFRLLLVEQIYRSHTIKNNMPYHK
tara:strand:- start:10882 stop:11346 length:465 start_codon:yes stop_codon:yes gene_type:complete